MCFFHFIGILNATHHNALYFCVAGTGKTKTIVELVSALLQCTNYDILLMSERNGAINAVAEKFKETSLASNGKKFKITNTEVWNSVMTYGSKESMGESTKLFTLDEKIL